MAPVHPTRAFELYWVMMIGFFANNVLPLRMGELVRAHVCGTKLHISRTASLGTILLERLCDTLSFLTTFLMASLFFPFPPYMKKGAWLLGGTCIAVIVALLLIHHHEDTFRAILEWNPFPVTWKTAACQRPKSWRGGNRARLTRYVGGYTRITMIMGNTLKVDMRRYVSVRGGFAG